MIEYTYVQDVPKNTNIQKTITKIEHCGARFYHVHDLGGLDPVSIRKKRPKYWFLDTGGVCYWYEPVHCGSSSILKVQNAKWNKTLKHNECGKQSKIAKQEIQHLALILIPATSAVPQLMENGKQGKLRKGFHQILSHLHTDELWRTLPNAGVNPSSILLL